MEHVKIIQVLKNTLLSFEQGIQKMIALELSRINRKVMTAELAFVSFIDEVATYIEAIKLDSERKIIIETSFADVEEKDVSAFISDN